MARFTILTSDEEDEMLQYLAQTTSQDEEQVIESVFQMMINAWRRQEHGLFRN